MTIHLHYRVSNLKDAAPHSNLVSHFILEPDISHGGPKPGITAFKYGFTEIMFLSATYYSIGGNMCMEPMSFDFYSYLGTEYNVTFQPY